MAGSDSTIPCLSHQLMRYDLIDEAVAIGNRICESASWHASACTWEIPTPDRLVSGGAPAVRLASDSLYNGTSGISVFLGELWRLTGEIRYLRCAEGALRFAELPSATSGSPVGLYVGGIGVAVAAARLARLTNSEEWRDLSMSRIVKATSSRISSGGLDVIEGAAGGILGLMELEEHFGNDITRPLALSLAAHLESEAVRIPQGWSWRVSYGHARQNLCGYSHGASGMAHSFLELFARTGESRWAYAAERSMQYERYRECSTPGDWPDFRSGTLSTELSYGGILELRRRALAGEPVLPRPSAPIRWWCHGSPGIALTRARAVSLNVGLPEVRAELERSFSATLTSLSNLQINHSLCHGFCGNAEAVFICSSWIAGMQHPPLWASMEVHLARNGVRSGTQWVTGGPQSAYDPSLLLGEAGIGHLLLRAAEPTIKSVLFLTDWATPLGSSEPRLHADLRRNEVNLLLPLTSTILDATSKEHPLNVMLDCLSKSGLTEAEIVSRLREYVPLMPTTEAVLKEGVELDLLGLEMANDHVDYVEQFSCELYRPSLEQVDWDSARVELAPHVRLVRTQCDWSSPAGRIEANSSERRLVACFRWQENIVRLWLEPIDSIIVSSLRRTERVSEIIDAVLEAVDGDADILDEVPMFVKRQLIAFIDRGLVRVIER